MICHKINFFFHDAFQVQLNANNVKLTNGTIQHKITFEKTTCVDWKFSKNEKNLKAFGILIYDNWQYFKMEENHIKVLKRFLDGKVQYRQIFKMYEIVSFLGKGAFGMVFKYMSRLNGQMYACKSIRKCNRNTEADFFSEIKCMQELRHPNLCQLKEYYIEQKHFYIIMEFIEGDTLKNLLLKQVLDEKEQIIIIKQLLIIANYFHSEGYIYRDFKLENILFEDNQINKLKLIDFGLSTKKYESTHQICGTPGYIPPEIFQKNYQYDYKADMFSLGVVIYELYTNTYLLAHKDQEQVYQMNKNYKFDESILLPIQNELIHKLLSNLLQNDPNERMNAKEALEFIDSYKNQSFIEYLTTNTD